MRRAPLVLLAGLYLATPVFAAPPTEEEIAAKTAIAMDFYRSKGDAFSLEDPEFHAVLNAQLDGIDPNECDYGQIEALGMLWQYTPTAKPIWLERVKALGSGDDWLDAALMLAGMDEMDAALEIGMMRGGFTSVPDERLGEVIGVMSMLDAMKVAPMRTELVLLADRMPSDSEALSGWVQYPALLQTAGVDDGTRKEVHAKLVDQMKATVAAAPEGRGRARLQSMIAFLETPAGRGELIGFPAPEIEFTWNSDGHEWNCFNCLRGSVVVLDFWATWCGPCVGSFPDVRELVEYFDGYDVIFLGLTSPQKRVSFGGDRGQVAAADFAEECALMTEYKKSMDMTWPIVMSKQDVFNPDFGIRGIPHVAILAPDGTVAYNGLHPAGDKAGKIDKINGLLKKAGLKHPPSLKESEANKKG
ncbi:MAG: hypothetical protein CMJ51_07325 [Planctomycetaceae bacterium]|nr:hypothetical protein [Planctomycetaceae bacterium]